MKLPKYQIVYRWELIGIRMLPSGGQAECPVCWNYSMISALSVAEPKSERTRRRMIQQCVRHQMTLHFQEKHPTEVRARSMSFREFHSRQAGTRLKTWRKPHCPYGSPVEQCNPPKKYCGICSM